MKMQRKKQDGAILFVVMMVMMLVSILVIMAVQRSKTSTQISVAQAQQVEAFDNAEAMLSRIRFALEQVPSPPSIAMNSAPDGTSTVIWVTKELASKANNNAGSNKKIEEPLFAQPEFVWKSDSESDSSNNHVQGLTCADIDTWLTLNGSAVDLDCEGTFLSGDGQEPRIFIEFITRQQEVGDIDSVRGAYFYRVTILGKGFNSGRSIVQGVTGVEYI